MRYAFASPRLHHLTPPKTPANSEPAWHRNPAPAVRHHCRTPHPIEGFSPVGPASSRKRAIRYRSSTELAFAFEPPPRHPRPASTNGAFQPQPRPTAWEWNIPPISNSSRRDAASTHPASSAAAPCLQIPTGFWPTAQGWRPSAYLGSSIPQSLSTPTGLRPSAAARPPVGRCLLTRRPL